MEVYITKIFYSKGYGDYGGVPEDIMSPFGQNSKVKRAQLGVVSGWVTDREVAPGCARDSLNVLGGWVAQITLVKSHAIANHQWLVAVAFVSFFTHHAALAAMASLNGSVFDPDNGDCLHIELAKSNSRKRHGGGGEVYRVIDKRVRTEENSDNDNNRDEGDDDVSGNDDGQGGSDGQSDEENDNSSDKNELPTDQSGEPGIKQQKGRSSSNDQPDKIPPCSTLFLSNLGQACTEKELEELLSKQPGFHVLKMRRRGGLPAAFADFTDIESSTAAMENLKGIVSQMMV
ncbi:Cell wall integrity protein scw1 [Triticum urartu]|uniref:Cell wall integrity protein scw1 n=1 Tax=Triticum urartu TaxID=4572 RepID=M7YZS4_TRIUA|nr:Cell wall integrity protein scw1 [Triticum urartu]